MKKLAQGLKWIIIVQGIILLLLGSMLFWGGYHNIDYTRNFLKLCYLEGLDYDAFGERNMGGEVVSFDEAYVDGLMMAIVGFYVSIIGTASLGYGLSIKSK